MFRTVLISLSGLLLALGVAAPARADLRVIPFTSGSGSIVSANGYLCPSLRVGPGVLRGCPDLSGPGPLTLTAVPDASPPGHWRFVRWDGGTGCGTTPSCTIEGDGFVSATAVFHDPVAPTITPTVTHSPTRDRTVTLGWTANEPASATCALDGAPLPACPESQSMTLPEGAYTFTVRGTDSADNLSAPVQARFRILDTELLSAPAVVSNEKPAVFRVATRQGTSFACQLDNRFLPGCAAPAADGTGTVTLPDLTEGTHTFRVYAYDGEDFDHSPIVRTWTVDTVAPEVTLAVGDGTFDFSSNEPTARFECRIDAGAFAPCMSGLKADAAPGEHRFAVRAVDRAGNVGAAVERTWTVAPPAPVLQPAPEPAGITTLAGRRKVSKQRTVALATVSCPTVCTVTVPKTVKVKIAGRRHTVAVTRTATRVGLKLSKAVYTKLKGRTGRLTVRIDATATGAPTTSLTLNATIGR